MSEEAAAGGEGGKSYASIIAFFIPKPTLRPVMFWQGIVETVARGVLVLLLLIMFGTSSAAENDAEDLDSSSQYRNAKAAAGFSIFVGVITFLYEIVFIVCRFLNFAFMIAARTIVLIVDIIVHSVSALLLFAAAVSLAYYADFSKDLAKSTSEGAIQDILNRVGDSLGAAAFFSFMSIFGMVFVIVWMVLYLVLKWDLGGAEATSSESKE